jgi:hypothetical protein
VIRRLFVLIAVATVGLAGPVAAASARVDTSAATTTVSNDYGDWFCIAVRPLDTGVCQGDPFPQQSPLPPHVVPGLLLPPLPQI